MYPRPLKAEFVSGVYHLELKRIYLLWAPYITLHLVVYEILVVIRLQKIFSFFK